MMLTLYGHEVQKLFSVLLSLLLSRLLCLLSALVLLHSLSVLTPTSNKRKHTYFNLSVKVSSHSHSSSFKTQPQLFTDFNSISGSSTISKYEFAAW